MIRFNNQSSDFTIEKPENFSHLYFPLASEKGLKSSISPKLGGDSKLNQETFLLEPTSVDDLHNHRSTRNFWVNIPGHGLYSATGNSASQEAVQFSKQQDESRIEAGFMWQTLHRNSTSLPIKSSITSFIPNDSTVELMLVTLENTGDSHIEIQATAAIPIFGRSADNIRDHRHVTSMLHRIQVTEHSVIVTPTMSFDERGHRVNHTSYFVSGFGPEHEAPTSFYPTVESFLGEGGTFTHPRSLLNEENGYSRGYRTEGQEAMGAFSFEKRILKPGESTHYIICMGIHENGPVAQQDLERYSNWESVQQLLDDTKNYWQEQVNLHMTTGQDDFDHFLHWVCFQPFLRRIFGCSFLPHHDYGRGGRGWRDLWQDCLSLLLMNPSDVRTMITENFKGVRIDGTNATIIGDQLGEFIADRNGIARVWMDHALWPLMTTRLYIDQTGDVDLLTTPVSYFKDPQTERGRQLDLEWTHEYGNQQKTTQDHIYQGSILEHLLLQHLTTFYDVGEHNMFLLRGADWNDALDMASERGESVAFTSAYAGNLTELARLIRLLEKETGLAEISVMKEMEILLSSDLTVFDSVEKKRDILLQYTQACRHQISGETISISLVDLAINLMQKADWIRHTIQKQEWIELSHQEGWFNSYYDNSGQKVEGILNGQIRMMLTGQVFALMSNVATTEQIRQITQAADHYLYKESIGGYRLNTNFHELKTDMGRMFGFAYGEKENGAVFSHMTVMYANALYQRGFVKEGWKALKTLADTSLDFNRSKIYPGIPEYFRSDGRGMYHYLTGAASWYLLTMATEVFGCKGKAGHLICYPKLLAEQFSQDGTASIQFQFADRTFRVLYDNPLHKDFGEYVISSATIDHQPIHIQDEASVLLKRDEIQALSKDSLHTIHISLQ